MAKDQPPDESDPPNALPRGTLLNDKFRVQRVIGVGGFGIVYLAHDEMSDVDVAIKEYMPANLAGRTKTMHVSLSSQSNADTFALGLKSFWNEARLLAKFRDEHLPLLKVYDAFQANGTAYMVMPVLRGRTAHQLRREMSKPPTERWLRTLLTDLLPALERLHAENVYHRDIAPDNIQIDINGKPVLMDLGAARHVISNRTQSITAILKPGYAPIEQYGESDKLRQGPWTDIYALGATLHFLLLNKSPASATARIFDTGTPLVAHDLPDCSPAFLRVIDWMLEPKPEARPQNVEQLRTALFDSDDATVMMAPKRTVPPPVARAAAPQTPPPPQPQPPPPHPPPQALAPTMPFTTAPTQAAPRTAVPAALAAFAATAAAATPPLSQSTPPTSPTPPRVSPPASPASPAPSAHAVAPAEAKSPLPMVLASVAALVLVAGAAVWLWPSSTPPAGTSARTAPASAPQVSKAAPATAPRPETTNVPTNVPATAVAPVSPPPAVAEPAQTAPPPAPVPSPSIAATPAPPVKANLTAADSEAARAAATAPTSTRRTPPAPPALTNKTAPTNDKDGALLPKPADPSAQAAAAPAPTPAPPPAPVPVAPAPAVAAPAPASNAVASPTERCADKGGSIARRVCVAVVCGLPELHNHAECTALRRN